MQQRPEHFRINPYSHFAQGLVFAGLGNMAGSTHCHDSSLYGNHGTLRLMDPAADWVWDAYLRCFVMQFDGVNNNIGVSLAIGTRYTFALSIYLSSAAANDCGLCGDTGNNQHWLDVTTGPLWRIAAQTPTVSYGNTQLDMRGQYHHICYSSDGTNVNMYLDGVYDGNGATGAWELDTIGASSPAGTVKPFAGLLGNILIYKRNISQPEITQLADPSNVMLSGMLLPPRRRLWAVSSGAAPPSFAGRSRILGGGIVA